MKAVKLRFGFRVELSPVDVIAFNLSWPGSRVIADPIWEGEESGFLEFDSRGDLVDGSESLIGDGPEFLAISEDAKKFGKNNLGIA